MKRIPLNSFIGPRYWPTWLGLAIMRGFSFLPLPLLAVFGQLLGLLAYALARSRRRIAYKNISVCFPEKTPAAWRRINRQHFGIIGQSVFTVPAHWWISTRRFNRRVEVIGREHYDAALASGRNIIILAPHFISFDVGGFRLAQERPMLSMYQYAKNGLIDEIVKRGRMRYGGELVERKASMRSLIRSIRKGHPFYYLPDQDAGRKGVFVPFFHEQASTYSVLGKFAQLSDAVVIPCRTRTKSWGQGYEVVMSEPLKNFPSGDEMLDTALMNQVIADMIRPNPEQYFWVHKRFKTRPKSEQDKRLTFYQ